LKKTVKPEQDIIEYFANPVETSHRQYLALRSFYYEGKTAEEVETVSGYSASTVYGMARDFKARYKESISMGEDPFFKQNRPGRKKQERDSYLVEIIVTLRKKQLSVPDIKVLLDSKGFDISEGQIYTICDENGFARLPKRTREERDELLAKSGYAETLTAPVSEVQDFSGEEQFASKGVGILCFLPFIKTFGIDKAIEGSSYPGTNQIGRLNSVLAFLALKLTNVQRYSQDDSWCMDRGLGMFAGLNVLPKTSWYSSYSNAIKRKDNIAFMKSLNKIYEAHGLFSDTANLDFTAIPYWGDEDPFENNWSGKRSKALISIQAALAQDPDTGIISYGDTTVKHDNQNNVVLEFLDFYKEGTGGRIEYLVFDSKFTTLENLGRINSKNIKFITIQRKSKNLNEKIQGVPESQWKTVKIEKANHKSRNASYFDSTTTNAKYGDQPLRQVFLKGKGMKPATIITNDHELSAEGIIRKYARRWLIENDISEQIHFFHLNLNSAKN
jgi:transposase